MPFSTKPGDYKLLVFRGRMENEGYRNKADN